MFFNPGNVSNSGGGIQGPRGPKGDKGDTGPQGPKGEKGDKGDSGVMLSDMVDYIGNQHESLKAKNDADVEWLLGKINGVQEEINTIHYEGQHITATNTIEGRSKSAILKCSTKYRDIDTGEFLETFEEGRNLELVSVRMPVLTTTGKNLFDVNNTHFISGLIHNANLTINSTPITKAYYIPCEPNTSYTISKMMTQYFRICETSVVPTIGCKVSNLVNNPSKASLTITTSESAKYLCFNVHNVNTDTMDESEVLATLQIEKGLVATSYEPYKSNILTVNEDVTLRSNGNVYDELDLLTGKLTQRIDEDGSVLTQEVVKTVALSDNHVYSYKDVTHYDCSSAEGSLVPTLSIDVPTKFNALVARQKDTIQELTQENESLKAAQQVLLNSQLSFYETLMATIPSVAPIEGQENIPDFIKDLYKLKNNQK